MKELNFEEMEKVEGGTGCNNYVNYGGYMAGIGFVLCFTPFVLLGAALLVNGAAIGGTAYLCG